MHRVLEEIVIVPILLQVPNGLGGTVMDLLAVAAERDDVNGLPSGRLDEPRLAFEQPRTIWSALNAPASSAALRSSCSITSSA